MTEALKPCPHCGSTYVDLCVSKFYSVVACGECEAEGPHVHDESEAVRKWNRRATPAPAQPEGQEDELIHQYRSRLYMPDNLGWGEWRDCDRGFYESRFAKPICSGFEYQVRALYLRPRPAGAAAPAEGVAWQPIESVPGTPEPVLLWTRAGAVRVETGWYAKNLLDESKEDDFECAFTHWRPQLVGPASPTPAQ